MNNNEKFKKFMAEKYDTILNAHQKREESRLQALHKKPHTFEVLKKITETQSAIDSLIGYRNNKELREETEDIGRSGAT